MNFIRHPSNNKDFGAPPPDEWDQTKLSCGTLPTTIGTDPNTGYVFVKSYWRPTEYELKLLNDGGAVELTMFTGGGMCPISMGTVGKQEFNPGAGG